MSDTLDFLGDGNFRAGLLAGALVAGGAVLARRTGRWTSPSPAVGVALVVATMTVIQARSGVPAGLVVGLLLLAAGRGVRVDRTRRRLIRAGAAMSGAVLVGWSTGLPDVGWIRLLVAVTAVVGGACLDDFDARWGSTGLGPALVAITVVGIYFTVPDTAEALALLGVSLAVAVLIALRPAARLGSAGSFVVAGLLAWVAATGGQGRQSSIVGGVACLGLLVLEPLARGLRSGAWSPFEAVPMGWVVPAVAPIHLAFVFVASRVAGLRGSEAYRAGGPRARGSVAGAAAIVVAEVVAFALVYAAGRRVAARHRPSSHSLE